MKAVIPWVLAASSGLALALAIPGPALWPLAVVFPGLLLEAIERARGRWRPWGLGLVAGIVHWIVAVNWVVPVMHHYGGLSLPVALCCLVAMAAILATTWALAAGITSCVHRRWIVWIFPCVWVVGEVVLRFPPFGFTWNGVASAVVDIPAFTASLPAWGATGLSWSVVAIGAGLWGLTRRMLRRTSAIAVAGAAACLALAGAAAPFPRPSGVPVAFAVVQPGTSLEEKWDPSNWREISDRVWAMTMEAAGEGAEIVLWPESAVPFSIERDASYRAEVENLASELGIEIVLNSIGPLADGGFANSAYLVTPTGLSTTRYDKVHLVPFGEFVPSWARFAFTESLVREVGAFTPGSGPVVLDAKVPIGVAICFEVVFPDLVAAQTRAGARVLTTLTNDGWYGFSWAPHQHFVQVRMRAAETGRWFVRAALTGVSAFVEPDGRVAASLEVGETGWLLHSVQPMAGLTLRARWGDWWAVLCAIAATVMLVASGAHEYRARSAGKLTGRPPVG